MTDRRSDQRLRVLKGGTISFGHAASIDCKIRNLSERGACLEVDSPVGIPNTFTLFVRKDAIIRRAHVKWRQARRIGVLFE